MTLKQRDSDDCTICAIAMATGLPYDHVLAVASDATGGYRYQGRPGTMSPRGVLMDLGFTAERVPLDPVQANIWRKLLWGRRAILSVPSLNGFDGHHDVYWDGAHLHDPSNSQTYPDTLADLRPRWAVVLDERIAA